MIKPNNFLLNGKSNNQRSQIVMIQQKEGKLNQIWNTLNNSIIGETKPDIGNTNNDITSNSFNQKDTMEKWSPKSSRSSRLISYIQEGETIEEKRRTSNEG